jgi:hypothetical protein
MYVYMRATQDSIQKLTTSQIMTDDGHTGTSTKERIFVENLIELKKEVQFSQVGVLSGIN